MIFQRRIFQKFGLQEPRWISQWKDFKFSQYNISTYFEEATYSIKDVVPFYAFDGQADSKLWKNSNFYSQIWILSQCFFLNNFFTDLEILPFFTLTHGRCFTFSPKNVTYRYSRTANFFFYLRHNQKRAWTVVPMRSDGFHIYFHSSSELFAGEISFENLIKFI